MSEGINNKDVFNVSRFNVILELLFGCVTTRGRKCVPIPVKGYNGTLFEENRGGHVISLTCG